MIPISISVSMIPLIHYAYSLYYSMMLFLFGHHTSCEHVLLGEGKNRPGNVRANDGPLSSLVGHCSICRRSGVLVTVVCMSRGLFPHGHFPHGHFSSWLFPFCFEIFPPLTFPTRVISHLGFVPPRTFSIQWHLSLWQIPTPRQFQTLGKRTRRKKFPVWT